MALAKGQTHIPIKQNTDLWNWPSDMINWFLTNGQRQFNVEWTVFSTNDTGTIGHPYKKRTVITYYIQKLTQTGP